MRRGCRSMWLDLGPRNPPSPRNAVVAAPGRSGIRVCRSAGSTLRVNLGVMRIQKSGLAGHPCRGLCGRGPVPRRAGVRRRLELAHLPGTQWEHPRPGHPHGAAARQEDSARTRAICGMSGRSRARLLCINQVVAKNTNDLYRASLRSILASQRRLDNRARRHAFPI